MAPASRVEDILFLEEILMRLPIKSLIHCRCVCKSWNSLFFNDPYFTRNRSISQDPSEDGYMILIDASSRTSCDLSMLSCTNLSETRIDKVPYPLSSQVNNVYLVGSINGLVCIAYHKDQDDYFILWNPVNHQSETILLPRRCPSMSYKLFGFGWDSLTDDYKLIAISRFFSREYSSIQPLVYSWNSDSWSSDVDVDILFKLYGIDKCYSPCVIVKGIPYWKFPKNTHDFVKFDVRTNKFARMNPDDLPGMNPDDFSLINIDDCLGLIAYYYRMYDYNTIRVHRFNEEANYWTTIHTINLSITEQPSGEIWLDEKIILYDPKSNQIKSLDLNEHRYFLHGFSYTPSLLALDGMKWLHP